jgi:hypothetical protein
MLVLFARTKRENDLRAKIQSERISTNRYEHAKNKN